MSWSCLSILLSQKTRREGGLLLLHWSTRLTKGSLRWVGGVTARAGNVGRTRGGFPPRETSLIASAFGDTDGEIFDRKNFRTKSFLGEFFFDPKICRPKNVSVEKLLGRKICLSKKISVENFAVRIAEGGSNGGGPGGSGAPPGPSDGILHSHLFRHRIKQIRITVSFASIFNWEHSLHGPSPPRGTE